MREPATDCREGGSEDLVRACEADSWWLTSRLRLPQLTLILLLEEWSPDADGAEEVLGEEEDGLLRSEVEVGDFLLLSEDLEMGTSGGMSLGGGVRKLDLEPPSLLPGEIPSRLLSPGFRDLRPSLVVDLALGDSVFLPSLSLYASLSFFSIGGMIGLEGPVSLPMLLHVCASRASGLFLASN